MSETITVGPAYQEDMAIGYGTASVILIDGSVATLTKLNFAALNAAYTVTFSATPVFDLQNGQNQTITLTGNVTSSTIVNGSSTVPTGSRLVLNVIEDGTGGRTFAYPTGVLATGSFPILTTASVTNRIELEYNGTNWVFVSIPLVVSSGGILGNVVIGTGTAGTIPLLTAASAIGNSSITDSGAGLVTFAYSSAADTNFWVANATNGAASRAVLTVGGNVATPDNINISLISQKSGNTSNGWNLTGVLRSGTGATNGMVISTAAGPIMFQPAGTTTTQAVFLSTTAASTYYNLEIGTTAATGTDATPLYVSRAQNGSTDIFCKNTSNTGNARASFRAQASSGADIYLAVTSASYSAGGGVTTNQAFIFTGASTTNGLVVQTTTGNLQFQIAGTTTIGTMTVRELQMTGRFRALNLSRVSPTSGTSFDLFCDGTSGVVAAATWGASEALSTLNSVAYVANAHYFYTAANYAAVAVKLTVTNGIQIGAPTGGDKGNGTVNAAGVYYANGTAGISTTITTAGLVGKTITVSNGIITGFA